MFTAFVAAMLVIAVVSCSCDSESVSRHVRDRKAYALGQEHGQKLCAKCHDEAAVQDALLDVRARMTNIHDRIGAQASVDYERGFTDYIKANNDSLARILF